MLILNIENFNQLDNIVWVDGRKVQLCLMYEYYAYCGPVFDDISLYKYLQFVFIMKQSQQRDTDYEFYAGFRQRRELVQRSLKRVEQMLFVILCENLSENEESEDTISRGHPEIDAH